MRNLILAFATFSALLLFGIAINSVINTPEQEPDSTHHVVPEYERHMRSVMFSLATNATSLSVQEPIINELPDYSEIDVLVPLERLKEVRQSIVGKAYEKRVKFFTFHTDNVNTQDLYMIFPEDKKLVHPLNLPGSPVGTYWAQDLFEPEVDKNGHIRLIVPRVYRWFAGQKDNPNKLLSDNSIVSEIHEKNIEIVRVPLVFRGGNLLEDSFNGSDIAFIGHDAILLTHLVDRSFDKYDPSDQEILKMLKKYLNVDEVIVIGSNNPQPEYMFHLDQAMIILDHGVAGVTKIVHKEDIAQADINKLEDVEEFLYDVREKLGKRGYKIVDIETSAYNVFHYQYVANSIPFINDISQHKDIIMPVYDDPTPYKQEIYKHNLATFRSLGYDVHPINWTYEKFKGGPHCLVNVLS
jgi:agmatine/peptidylarginine deiminase